MASEVVGTQIKFAVRTLKHLLSHSGAAKPDESVQSANGSSNHPQTPSRLNGAAHKD